jgi:hypothetical protein
VNELRTAYLAGRRKGLEKTANAQNIVYKGSTADLSYLEYIVK